MLAGRRAIVKRTLRSSRGRTVCLSSSPLGRIRTFIEAGALDQRHRLRRQVYGSTFSRTSWRLYGGAKGLVMCYYDRQALRESVDSVTSFAFGPGGDMGMPSPLREAPTSPDSPPRLGAA